MEKESRNSDFNDLCILPQTGHVADLNRCWEDVLHLANRTNYIKGTTIPHQQQRGFYYLSRGSVGIFYISSCGRERLTLCIKPGCIFNEARSIGKISPEGHFVCMEESEVWRFPEKLLEDPTFIREHPAQIINLLRSMGIKMLIHYTFLAEMGTGNHEVHLCRFILALARKHNSRTFSCHMTQQEVADLLGIHRATLARVLQNLKQANVISSFTSHKIQIEDWDKLNALASR